VADLACGQGYSTLAIARAYPNAQVDGYDLDEASIRDAAAYVEGSDAGDRITFTAAPAAELAAAGPYDLVCIFEALHDMSQPVEVLAAVRNALAADGSVLIADERVADSFTAPGNQVERMMYGWSVSHCLPASMSEQPSAALGTVLRSDTVRALAADAGYSTTEILPIENDFFRFYRLLP
jgi:2-polyprenyl-3-methyl-5-hydroxy-6-metoxy-1,4-benzoquinol methylase